MWPDCEADHSPIPCAEIKKEWSFTSMFPMRLHNVMFRRWETFSFPSLLVSMSDSTKSDSS
jgi:hypothetical protein